VRGNSFITIHKWIKKKLTPEQYGGFVDAMNPEVAGTLTRCEAKFWYPLEHLTAIYEHISAEIGKGDETVLQKLGTHIAEVDLGGILKPIVAFVSIPRAIRRAPYLWPRYDDSGEFRVVELDEENKSVVFELTDYEGGPLHCVIIRSWLKKACELIGGLNVGIVETSCRWKDGGNNCRWELTWE
jgi:hypothetical protein